ncbi:hypothetical protein [Thioalkalivibrio sulfidiphilus]|uniref:hypothetical protein n=1 Tax=Thioalkalivibrio sulfidiphilus TaxID=1033854 RepID=UPI0012DF8307|nr:hypothetical protein [Thioalkalivibrio sulfidiphilus]
MALQTGGALFYGDGLRERADTSVHGYWTSHSASVIADLSEVQRETVRKKLAVLAQSYNTVIMSNEGWGPHLQHFPNDGLFAELAEDGFDITILAYVRPQVEWMNSAWWQWGAWTEAPLPRWVNSSRPKAQWASLMDAWAGKPWVKHVHVRLLTGDVIEDFMSYLGFNVQGGYRANYSLPGVVLRLFQRNRELRPGPHDSAIEFALGRQLHFDQGKSPWVIGPKLAEQLLVFYREDNQKLMELLPVDQSETMRADPRWWSMEPYLERKVSPAEGKVIESDELERLAVAALEAIYRLDGEVRQLRTALDRRENNQGGQDTLASSQNLIHPVRTKP